MKDYIDVNNFIKNNQQKICDLVNISLNRSGEIVQKKVSSGEVGSSLQEVLPLILYEALVTNTVSTLRLVADMINENGGDDEDTF